MATVDEMRPLLEQGYSYTQIGARLGVSRNSVAGALFRAGVTRPRQTAWSDEDVALLRELYAAGARATAISAALGKTVKAVKARITRMGLTGLRLWRPRPKPKARVHAEPRPKKPKRTGYQFPPSTPKPPTRVVAEIPPSGAVTFDDLAGHQCRWPYGDEPPFMFCGEPAAFEMRGGKLKQRPYCSGHCAKAFDGFGRGARAGERVRTAA